MTVGFSIWRERNAINVLRGLIGGRVTEKGWSLGERTFTLGFQLHTQEWLHAEFTSVKGSVDLMFVRRLEKANESVGLYWITDARGFYRALKKAGFEPGYTLQDHQPKGEADAV